MTAIYDDVFYSEVLNSDHNMVRTKQTRSTGHKKMLAMKTAKKSAKIEKKRSFCSLDYIAGRHEILSHLEKNGYDKDTMIDMTKDLFYIADDLQLNPEQTAIMVAKLYFLHKVKCVPNVDLSVYNSSSHVQPSRCSVKQRDSDEILYFRTVNTQDQTDDNRLYYCEECGEEELYHQKDFINHANEHFE